MARFQACLDLHDRTDHGLEIAVRAHSCKSRPAFNIGMTASPAPLRYAAMRSRCTRSPLLQAENRRPGDEVLQDLKEQGQAARTVMRNVSTSLFNR
jgi:hypothetical protein